MYGLSAEIILCGDAVKHGQVSRRHFLSPKFLFITKLFVVYPQFFVVPALSASYHSIRFVLLVIMATEIRANNILSDEEDESDDGSKIVELKGYLNKWTNYIHGWQRRFFVFSNGTLSYYKSELEAGHGCRGTISLRRATIKVSRCANSMPK